MKQILLTALSIFIVYSSHSQIVSGQGFIKGTYVEAGLRANGAFGTTIGAPSEYVYANKNLGFIADVGKDGWTVGTPPFIGDFFVPGVPYEGFAIKMNGTNYKNYGHSTPAFDIPGSLTNFTSDGTSNTLEWTGTINGLKVRQVVTLGLSKSYLLIRVYLKNTSASSINNVFYTREVDPDNEQVLTGIFQTNNYISEQNPNASSSALVAAKGTTHNSYLGLGTKDCRARVAIIHQSWPNAEGENIWNGTGVTSTGSILNADHAISLSFKIGNMLPGDSTTFAMAYVLNAADLNTAMGETETYFNVDGKPYVSGSTALVCSGNPIQLTINNGEGYNWVWSPPTGLDKTTGTAVTATISSTSTYSVTGTNVCGTTKTISLTVVPVPNSVTGAAGPITGSTVVCRGQNATFTVAPITNATNYVWSLPPGATVVSGFGTNSITLNFGSLAANGNLSVYGENSCTKGTASTVPITVSTVPPSGGSLSGPTIGCRNEVITFVLNGVSNAGEYIWDITGAASVTGTGNTRTVTIGTSNIVVKVKASNVCGQGTEFTRNVSVTGWIPSFNVNNASQCFKGHDFVFTNTIVTSVGLTHEWHFGDGTTATTLNASHKYAIPGNYKVKLVSTSTNGCKDSIEKTINVFATPVASFTLNDNAQCITGNSFAFTNTSSIFSGAIATHDWRFGDGNTSSAISPVYSYTTEGVRNAVLIITSDNGCKDTSALTSTTVDAQPVAGFTVNKLTQCLPDKLFVFTNTTTNSFTSAWSFGDGSTSTNLHNSYAYINPGTYVVKLEVSTVNGCIDSLKQTVKLFDKPSVSFTLNTANQCLNGNSYSFVNPSSVSDGTLDHKWTFDDGNISTDLNPTYNYATPGMYTVKLVSTSSNGCKDSSFTNINVYASPVVNFTVNSADQCLSTNNFIYTNASSIVTGTNSYEWKFGDGRTATTTDASNVFATPGNYTTWLIATSDKGCKDSISKKVNLFTMPVASFTVANPGQCENGNSFAFVNNSIGAASYLWDFGNGVTSADPTPVYSYPTSGDYKVKLLTVSGVCKDSIAHTMSVHPKVNVGVTVNEVVDCVWGNNFIFTNTSNAVGGTIATYSWSFGDGNTSTVQSPTHKYLLAGNYNVKLLMETDKGCTDSTKFDVTLLPSPIADFTVTTIDKQCITGNAFSFANASTGSIASYAWEAGDGTTSPSPDFSHTYTTAGTHDVKLTVTAPNGCSSYLIVPVTVHPKPSVAISVPAVNQCINGNVYDFINGSTVTTGTMTYAWTFGDGNTSTLFQPVHTYGAAGNYKVKLTATSDKNCVDSTDMSVTIFTKPDPSFTINKTENCFFNNSFSVQNTSSIASGTYSFEWQFGDGNTSALASTNHSYATAGSYVLQIVTISNNGCRDSVSKTINVYPEPVVSFAVNSDTQCLNTNRYILANATTIPAGGFSNQWSFGDGNVSFDPNPVHSFALAGDFKIRLIATSDKGCIDSSSQPVTIHPNALVSFTVDRSEQCLAGNTFTFNSNSTVSSGTFAQEWKMDDGTIYSAPGITHSFATARTFNVQLKTVTDQGCSDSLQKLITVHPQPVVAFDVNDLSQCEDVNNFIFTNTSQIATGTMTYNWDFADGNSSTDLNPVYSYTSIGRKKVKLSATSDKGCTEFTTTEIKINPVPVAAFNITDATQCLHGNNFELLNGSSIAYGTFTNNWTYSDGTSSTDLNPTKSFINAGTYNVELFVVSDEGCKSGTTMLPVTVHPHPTMNVGFDVYVLEGKNVTLQPVVRGTDLTYSWSPDINLSSSTVLNPLAYNIKSDITYRITATGIGGCTEYGDINIKLLKKPVAPNAFTPNGDGINDTWDIPNLDKYPNATVEIYNRYGQVVYRASNYRRSWDGMSNGKPLPVSVYYYVIDPKNGAEVIKGSVHIIR